MNTQTIAAGRVYVDEKREDEVVVRLPGTNYRLYLKPVRPVTAEPGKRISGVIRCAGWKVDQVSPGGAYVEPVYGRPRRVQGRVIAAMPEGNAVVVEVCRTPFVCELPDRWPAEQIEPGRMIAVDVYPGSTFEAV